jgi:hypothetical protein
MKQIFICTVLIQLLCFSSLLAQRVLYIARDAMTTSLHIIIEKPANFRIDKIVYDTTHAAICKDMEIYFTACPTSWRDAVHTLDTTFALAFTGASDANIYAMHIWTKWADNCYIPNGKQEIEYCSIDIGALESRCNTNGMDSYENMNENAYVYPNPTDGVFYIRSSANTQIMSVQIFDMYYKAMLSTNNPSEISVDTLADGLYVVFVQTQHGTISRKITVLHKGRK